MNKIQFHTLCCSIVIVCISLIVSGISITPIDYEKNTTHHINITFCPENCTAFAAQYIQKNKPTICLFYDLDEQIAATINLSKNITVGIDPTTYTTQLQHYNITKVSTKSLMHNKFCVNEQTIFTGSANPTINDYTKNHNILVEIDNPIIAQKYQEYAAHKITQEKYMKFSEPRILHNDMHICFSPDGKCMDVVSTLLNNATKHITLYAFSATHPLLIQSIADAYIRKNITVTIVLDKKQCNTNCIGPVLENMGVPIQYYQGPAKLHHKTVIIDHNIIILGSMNPSKNGDDRNDENTVIFNDPKRATDIEEYLQKTVCPTFCKT